VAQIVEGTSADFEPTCCSMHRIRRTLVPRKTHVTPHNASLRHKNPKSSFLMNFLSSNGPRVHSGVAAASRVPFKYPKPKKLVQGGWTRRHYNVTMISYLASLIVVMVSIECLSGLKSNECELTVRNPRFEISILSSSCARVKFR
jgi:hypothetical protein